MGWISGTPKARQHAERLERHVDKWPLNDKRRIKSVAKSEAAKAAARKGRN